MSSAIAEQNHHTTVNHPAQNFRDMQIASPCKEFLPVEWVGGAGSLNSVRSRLPASMTDQRFLNRGS